MNSFVALLMLLLLVPPAAHAIVYDPTVCDDIETVAEELVELDLAGMRQQGEPSKCLDPAKFKAIKPEQFIYGEGGFLPRYTLPKGRTVKVEVPTRNEATDVYTVKYHYIAKDRAGQPKNVTDRLSFSLHHKNAIKTNGCARLVDEPEKFAMREECLAPPVKRTADEE